MSYLPFIGMTGVEVFFFKLYQWQDLKSSCVTLGPFCRRLCKLLKWLNRAFEPQMQDILGALNGGFGYLAHFIWQTEPSTTFESNRAWFVREFDTFDRLLFGSLQLLKNDYSITVIHRHGHHTRSEGQTSIRAHQHHNAVPSCLLKLMVVWVLA